MAEIVYTTESRSTETRIDRGYRFTPDPDPRWHDLRPDAPFAEVRCRWHVSDATLGISWRR